MANEKKEQMFWMGHPIRDEAHARDLHLAAAIAQHHKGMTREQAEAEVIENDRRERHAQMAAHHLNGMKAANAVGNREAAEKHHSYYSLHMKSMGHDPMGAVPEEVHRWTKPDGKKQEHFLDFKAHPDDATFLTEPIQKSEPLAKTQKPKTRITQPKEFAVHRTFLRNRQQAEHRAWDYTSHLSDDLYNQGYRMYVLSHGPGNPIRVHALHHPNGAGPTWGQRVGGVVGNVEDGDLGVESFFANGSHANKGLETQMLNAAVVHAKHHMGARSLSYGEFTPEAGSLIESVAAPHGLELGDLEEYDEPVPGKAMAANGMPHPRSKRDTGHRPVIRNWWSKSEVQDALAGLAADLKKIVP